ncbi:MAG: hypothetical protein ACP5D1_02250 [Bacteroidales bacterium]
MRIILVCLYLTMTAVNHGFAREKTRPVTDDSLQVYFERIHRMADDRQKMEINRQLVSVLQQALAEDTALNRTFGDVRNLGILVAPDSSFRIIQWNIPLNDGTHYYQSLIQKKNGIVPADIMQLSGRSGPLNQAGDGMLTHDRWYGCLYYDMITVPTDSVPYYVLLGTDMYDLFSSRKIIDVLWFDRQGDPVFGLPVFIENETPVCRMIFEYTAQATMTLRYHPDRHMIIFDHLSPPDPSLTGQYRFYGPDFSYDGLKFREGKWHFTEDVDVRNR